MSGERATSIRTRLALAYAGAVAVAVLLYATGVYVFVRATLSEQLDARIEEDLERTEHDFEARPQGFLRWKSLPPEDERPAEAPLAEIADTGGIVLLRRPAAAADWTGYRVRTLRYTTGGATYVLRVGRSEAPLRHELSELLLLLGACLVPLLAVAWLGGRWLASRALAPVRTMTEQAATIGAERLSTRLEIDNPRDELGRLGLVFNEVFARLERSFEALKRFTADASHELRTPLTALRSVGEVALREARTPEQQREALGSMLEEAERLTRLVEDLLTLARGDAGGVPTEPAAVDLAALARDVVGQLGVLAEERRVTLRVEPGEAATAWADPRLVRRAVANLLDNAIKYAPPGTTVTLRGGGHDGRVSLEVVDAGPGIPPEHRERVFERFYRADPSRHGQGTGLGLSIARWAVEACGGTLELDPTTTKGARFRLLLPRAPAP